MIMPTIGLNGPWVWNIADPLYDALHLKYTGPIVTQGSMRAYGPGRVTHDKREELDSFRRIISHSAVAAGREAGIALPFDEPVAIRLEVRLQRPKSVRHGLPSVKPDLDKIQRAIGDALAMNKAVIVEDSRIVAWYATKEYDDRPGLDLWVAPIGVGLECA